jgi:hypothetical protein
MSSDIKKQFISRQHLYSLGRDVKLNCNILSIPVSNRLIDYEEYYKLTDEQYHSFIEDENLARQFADECRQHLHDDLLTLQPGTDRGVPR